MLTNLIAKRDVRRHRPAALVALVAAVLLFGQALFDPTVPVADSQADDDALTLRSKSLGTDTNSVPHPHSSIEIFAVAAAAIALVVANAVAEAGDCSILGAVRRMMGNERADHLYLPVTINRSDSDAAVKGHILSLGPRRASLYSAERFKPDTQVTIALTQGPGQTEDFSFHGIVMHCQRDVPGEDFTVEARVTTASAQEKNALAHRIAELRPNFAVG